MTPTLNYSKAGSLTLAMNQQMLDSRIEASRVGKAVSFVYAETPEIRAACYKLVFDNYLEKGFVVEEDGPYYVNELNDLPGVLTIAALAAGKVVGTISCFPGIDGILPADQLFSEELERLRSLGSQLTEVGRLAVHPDYQNTQEVITGLINRCYLYPALLLQHDQMVIEVNPRHTFFYEKLLNFKRIGNEKVCSMVNGAPAILLSEDLNLFRSLPNVESINKRCMFHKFMDENETQKELEKIKNLKFGLTDNERSYYGLGLPAKADLEILFEMA